MTDSLAKIEAFIENDYQTRINSFQQYVDFKNSLELIEDKLRFARLMLEYATVQDQLSWPQAISYAASHYNNNFVQTIEGFQLQRAQLRTSKPSSEPNQGIEYVGATPHEERVYFKIWKKIK